MTLDKLYERKKEIETQLESLQKQITDLKTQISIAEERIRQWTDTALIQRGRMIELDILIHESEESVRKDDEDED